MELINSHIPNKPLNIKTVPSLWQIAREVADKHELTIEAMRSRRRMGPISAARFEYFYRAAVETDKTWAQIGRVMLVDHTSVGYGAQRYAHKNGLPLPRGSTWCRTKVAATYRYPRMLKATDDSRTILAIDKILEGLG